MSTMTIARPGTPFPSDESLSYFNQPMSNSSSSRRLSQSIHFPLPTRPVLTPPSLLQRASSSGSSHYHLSRTPSYEKGAGARRSSTCSASSDCSSSMSSPMPTTPQVIAEENEDDLNIIDSTSFELPESFSFPSSPSPASKRIKNVNAIERFTSSTPSFDMSPPSRPKLKRRDTPRPKSDVLAMAPLRDIPTLSPIDESLPKRRFTSVVDGKSWLVVA